MDIMRATTLVPPSPGTTHPEGIAKALTGGAYLSLAQLPSPWRAEVTATMEQRVALVPAESVGSMETVVNPWTGEFVRHSLEGKYRAALAGELEANGYEAILPPSRPEVVDAFQLASRHLGGQGGARALESYPAIVRHLCGIFLVPSGERVARQVWCAASLHERQTILNLLFGGLVYLRVQQAIGERILDLGGQFGSPIELGLAVRIDTEGQLRYLLCRGDPDQVFPMARSIMLEHIHPLRPIDPGTRDIYDTERMLVPLDRADGVLMTGAVDAIASVGDLVEVSALFARWRRRQVADPIAARVWPHDIIRHRVLHPAGGALVQYDRKTRTFEVAWAENPVWPSDGGSAKAQHDIHRWSLRPRGRHVRFIPVTFDDILRRRFDRVFPARA